MAFKLTTVATFVAIVISSVFGHSEHGDHGSMQMGPSTNNATTMTMGKAPERLSFWPDVFAFLGTLMVTAAIAVPCAIFASRCQKVNGLGAVGGPEYHRLKQTNVK